MSSWERPRYNKKISFNDSNTSTFVIDHGSFQLKLGQLFVNDEQPIVLPNAATRCKAEKTVHIGKNIENCSTQNQLAFLRPFDKGYCVNWNLQETIFDAVFNQLKWSLQGQHVVLSEPQFTPPPLRHTCWEVMFEDYECETLYTAPSTLFSSVLHRAQQPDSLAARQRTCLVIDCGYAATHITPIYDNRAINHASRRVDVGGKALTNYLKELISLRHFNVMDEPTLVNAIREQTCFVASDFEQRMRRAKRRRRGEANDLLLRYALPASDQHAGFVVDEHTQQQLSADSQILSLTNERICVPELLFRPSDVGLAQAGVAETVVQSVSACAQELAPMLFSSIVVTGGTSLTHGFMERLESELRALVSDDIDVCVERMERPVTAAFDGAVLVAQQEYIAKQRVTRQEYMEKGKYYIDKKQL